jgi:membrane-anchored protein YejM (alkaline phosphatase superfamily)
MMFDLSSRLSGFRQYYGLDEYPDKSDFDGSWGIFDKPFFQFSASQINKMQSPFAACIFSLSSHHPYTLPQDFHDTSGTKGNPVYKVIRYADDALRQFFKTSSQMPWYPHTLFVITADHFHRNFSPAFNNHAGNFDVPLILFSPNTRIVADTSSWIQHSDIRPAILDVLGLRPEKENYLSQRIKACKTLWPMQHQDGNYFLLHPKGQLSWDAKSTNSGWSWNSPGQHTEPEGLKAQMMARIQYYRNGLIEDKLFRK